VKFRTVFACLKRRGRVDSGKEGMVENSKLDMNAVPKAETADVSRFCPTCGSRMRESGCKLKCDRCGFFLSCSDFY
jgi:hypothetical protein